MSRTYDVWRRRGMHIGICWGNPKGRRLLGRPRRGSENSIKMDLREIGWGVMNWIHLV
jgi:hypothetical protein